MFNNSTYFSINNKSSELFNGTHSLIIVGLDDTMENSFGLTYQVIKENDRFNFGRSVVYGVSNEAYQTEIDITLVKEYRDSNNKVYHREPVCMTETLREDIATFLQYNYGSYQEFCFDENESLVYFGNILSIVKNGVTNPNMGTLKLGLEFESSNGRTRTLVDNYTVRDGITKQITIENKSNVTNYSRPYVGIRMIDGSTRLVIKNINTGKETIFDNMPLDMEIKMYNDTREIVCSDKNFRYGLKSNFNRQFLELKDGYNTLSITGNCLISFQDSYIMAQ